MSLPFVLPTAYPLIGLGIVSGFALTVRIPFRLDVLSMRNRFAAPPWIWDPIPWRGGRYEVESRR